MRLSGLRTVALVLAFAAGTTTAAAGKPDRSASAAAASADLRAMVEAGLPADLALVQVDAPADLGADLEVRWKTAPRPGKNRVMLLSGPERSRRTRWIAIDLARKAPVVVARHGLLAGSVVSADDLTVEDRPSDGALALDASAMVGLRIRRAVAAGATLTESDVELGPPLGRGTTVEILIRSGSLTVSARGRLESTGRVGDEVRVLIDATRRIVSGRLTGAGTVMVGTSGVSAGAGTNAAITAAR